MLPVNKINQLTQNQVLDFLIYFGILTQYVV